MKVKKFKFDVRLKRKLDKLASLHIHKLYNNTCVKCGRNGKTDCAHLIPKEFSNLRWIPDNLLLLCSRCHRLGRDAFHQSPFHFCQWYISKYGIFKPHELLKLSEQEFDSSEENINKIIQGLTH